MKTIRFRVLFFFEIILFPVNANVNEKNRHFYYPYLIVTSIAMNIAAYFGGSFVILGFCMEIPLAKNTIKCYSTYLKERSSQCWSFQIHGRFVRKAYYKGMNADFKWNMRYCPPSNHLNNFNLKIWIVWIS